ncbi:uncharacterized protein TRAVEDRAFT_45681 [Trametes versicolor FP-101664 SS1]|uniref:uncharacterized protein n=1 Tax=Trametes versicolor (strain FP-101664) TaxID=717944 RepID=UPI0004623397|nr:uncharacterized protein TRAVEDRAFT_45681 [Trametes versicolor FP-101664 SS1]EIW60430.1 hypothetical protein TRAVEDRAFT_45681 [Trametes versicolor FP-101664 SS1]
MNASGLARAATLSVLGQVWVRRRSARGEMNIKNARSGPGSSDAHAEMGRGVWFPGECSFAGPHERVWAIAAS